MDSVLAVHAVEFFRVKASGMTTLRFAFQALLLVLVGMAALQIIFSLRSTSEGAAVPAQAFRSVLEPSHGSPRSTFSKGLLTLSLDEVSPPPSASWTVGAFHAVFHEAFVPGQFGNPWSSCVWSEGVLESLRDTVVRLRVDEKPRPSRLETYARQKGLRFRVVLRSHAEFQNSEEGAHGVVHCRRWRHVLAPSPARNVLTLREGVSKVISSNEVVSLVRVEGNAAVVVRDVLSSVWRIEGVEPGLARFHVERLPGPRKELLHVRVLARRQRPQQRRPTAQSTPRAGVFLIPGWPPFEPSGKTLP